MKSKGEITPKHDLLHLHDPHLVTENLKLSFSKNQIYTQLGSTALIILNPKRALESSSDATSLQYLQHSKNTAPTKLPLPPHLFALADQVWTRMVNEHQDQSILISGVTGSGKSESRKLIIKQLCALSTVSKKKSNQEKLEKYSKLVSNIQKAETIFDAFGNAKTTSSSSSSRYIKYTEIQYNSKGRVVGAKTLDYLLEKGRVCDPFEKNFHVFYWLVSGVDDVERNTWKLDGAFEYLRNDDKKGKTDGFVCLEDNIKFAELKDNLKSLGIGKRIQSQIFTLLSAILHLGNITFQDELNKPHEPCFIKNRDTLEFVAELLGVFPSDLELVLTYQTKLVKRELCTVYLNAQDACKQRDSLAVTLYSLLFTWIVEHVNGKLCKDDCGMFVGILDLGDVGGLVKPHKKNDFQNLLKNYAGELIHEFANKKMVLELLADLKKDDIIDHSTSIPEFVSNAPQVEFFNHPQKGMLALIDAECVRYSGRSTTSPPVNTTVSQGIRMTEHLTENFSGNPLFVPCIVKKESTTTFSIKHYDSIVEYDSTDFVSCNLDVLCPDFVTLFNGDPAKGIEESENTFAKGLFSDKLVSTRSHWKNKNVLVAASTAKKPTRQPSVRRKRKPIDEIEDSLIQTQSTSFQSAFSDLLNTLNETIVWSVYCISPNTETLGLPGTGASSGYTSNKFDALFINDQLRHFGISSIVAGKLICRDYSVLMGCDEFLERFKFIIKSVVGLHVTGTSVNRVEEFGRKSEWTEIDYAVGRNDNIVYLTEGAYRSLLDENKEIKSRMKQEEKMGRNSGVRASFVDDESNYSASDNDGSEYEGGSMYASDSASATLETPQPVSRKRNASTNKAKEMKFQPEEKLPPTPKKKNSPARNKWLCMTWCLTWWIPSFFLSSCGKMKRKDMQIAWREKVALCIWIAFFCCFLLFFIIGLGKIICPIQQVFSTTEVQSKSTPSDPWVYAYGRVYRVDAIQENHLKSYGIPDYTWFPFGGTDVSYLFNKVNLWDRYCGDLKKPQQGWDDVLNRPSASSSVYYHTATDPATGIQKLYLEYMNQYAKARVAHDWEDIRKQASAELKLVVIYDNVYDVTTYVTANTHPFGETIGNMLNSEYGMDITKEWNSLKTNPNVGPDLAQKVLKCMNEMFYVGVIDNRRSPQCLLSNYILVAASAVIVLVILVKFLAALQFGSKQEPEDHDKFVILQMPCYTEGPDSLSKSLESLAAMRYDDKRKLLFVICDGMIVGSGNDRPTPRIVLDILGVNPTVDPEALPFESLGEGDKQLNYGKVYSGLYEIQGRSVPYIVVVKVGAPTERQRPGNRGKRDSQMLLMRFLSRVHFNHPMNKLELEMYHQLKNVIGVNPSFYEYCLMVDADTETHPDALNRMISSMIHDSKIMGLCGETLISNEKDSWITMIQVYEYFISHHLAKAFESLFGSVTCLPGCFCMYRIRTPSQNIPLLISPAIIKDYAENTVETLHMKNLLHLGEDRYLTTLMLKHFSNYKLTFTNDALCQTNAPDRWAVLLSQRRRWINSTVHNLLELMMVPQLCGFCCFSMRFIVFLDLFSTVVQPAAIVYIGYLIYTLATLNDSNSVNTTLPIVSIAMLAGLYGLQVIIFIVKRQWAQIGWMVVYLLALPVFSFYIPVYAFWHFDDFSWGNTRVILGEDGKKAFHSADQKPFDPKSITLTKWSDHENEVWEKNSQSQYTFRSNTPSNNHQNESVYGGSYYDGSTYSQQTPPIYDNRISMFAPGSNYAPPGSGYGGVVGVQPTDEELLFEVRRILSTANLMNITKKQVRDELSAWFKVDLSGRKGLINGYIEDILQGKL